MVLFWLHLASTIPSNAAPEAGRRARVGPATVNTQFNSGAITRMIGQARRATLKTQSLEEWFWRLVFVGVCCDFLYLGWFIVRSLRAHYLILNNIVTFLT